MVISTLIRDGLGEDPIPKLGDLLWDEAHEGIHEDELTFTGLRLARRLPQPYDDKLALELGDTAWYSTLLLAAVARTSLEESMASTATRLSGEYFHQISFSEFHVLALDNRQKLGRYFPVVAEMWKNVEHDPEWFREPLLDTFYLLAWLAKSKLQYDWPGLEALGEDAAMDLHRMPLEDVLGDMFATVAVLGDKCCGKNIGEILTMNQDKTMQRLQEGSTFDRSKRKERM